LKEQGGGDIPSKHRKHQGKDQIDGYL